MWEIGRKHDAVNPDMLALLDRDPLVLHAEIDMLSYIVARQFLQRLEAEIFLGPAEVALIPKIGVLEPEWHPAEACFREKDLQFREPFEYAGKDELRNADRRRQAEIADPFEEGPPQSLHDFGDFFRIAECRL